MPVSKKRKKNSKTRKMSSLVSKPVPKLSKVIMDFAEPLLVKISNDFEASRKLVTVAVAVWNASLLPTEERENLRRDIRKAANLKGRRDKATFNEIFDYFLYRKDTYFRNDRRFVLDHQLTEEGDQLHLTVISGILPDGKKIQSGISEPASFSK